MKTVLSKLNVIFSIIWFSPAVYYIGLVQITDFRDDVSQE